MVPTIQVNVARRLRLVSPKKYLLSKIPCKNLTGKSKKAKLPKRRVGRYKPADPPFKFIPERFWIGPW